LLEEFQNIWEIDASIMEEIHEDSDEDEDFSLVSEDSNRR
jgi:hypothetical protein